MAGGMNVSLILVDLDCPSAGWQSNICLAVEATTRRLYVYFEGTKSILRMSPCRQRTISSYELRREASSYSPRRRLACLAGSLLQ